MRSRRSLWSAFAVLWLVGSALARAAPPETSSPEPGPIVLELFTSQGCSSCPPADQVLSRLGLDEETQALVVPLAFHVDYWDRIGWTDPFGSAAWSARQDAYCRALAVEAGPYTPQLVVNGRVELNGSQQRRALGEIEKARRQPSPARVTLSLAGALAGTRTVRVRVSAEVVGDMDARKLDMLVALFENGLITAVGRGENRGRSLRDDFVVRRLEKAFSLAPTTGAHRERELELKLERGFEAENLGVAAFLQDPASMRIHAAAVARPPLPLARP